MMIMSIQRTSKADLPDDLPNHQRSHGRDQWSTNDALWKVLFEDDELEEWQRL